MEWIDVIGFASAGIIIISAVLFGIALGIFLFITLINGCIKLWR